MQNSLKAYPLSISKGRVDIWASNSVQDETLLARLNRLTFCISKVYRKWQVESTVYFG